MRVAIIGGGLGGMAAAAAMQKYGIHAEVFERAPEFGEVGAGLQMGANAIRAFEGIGILSQIEAIGNRRLCTRAIDMRSGQILDQTIHDDPSMPYYQFHRADLLDAIRREVDPTTVHPGHQLVGIVEQENAIRLDFATGGSRYADVVIGADGSRSVVRAHLWGESSPDYTGQIIWRALIPSDRILVDVLRPDSGAVWVGPGGHIVAYHLRGDGLINVGVRAESTEWVDDSWSIPGDPDEMRATFGAMAEPRLKALLDAVETCSKWGIFAREPSPEWGRGRIQLLGDAAHPMLPDAGQGASQAIEDAYTLARWLHEEPNAIAALKGYERVRKPWTHAVQRQSKANAELYHARDGVERDKQLAKIEERKKRGETFNNLAWIHRHDPVADWDSIPEPPTIF